jgi:hypothetical protein
MGSSITWGSVCPGSQFLESATQEIEAVRGAIERGLVASRDVVEVAKDLHKEGVDR